MIKSIRNLCYTTLTTILLLTQSVRYCNGWWNNGHLIVARIAYDLLDQDTVQKTQEVLRFLSTFTTLEKNYPFVECATFADAIKGKGWDDQAEWHFVDNPFFDENFTDPNIYYEYQNITWALGEILSSFNINSNEVFIPNSQIRNHQESPSNQEASNGGSVSWNLADSFNLRLLIHYIGDIHQPLHSSSRYTKDFPHGDRGGNSFYLQSKNGVSNLHALWDSVLYTECTEFNLPLSESDWQKLGNISQEWRENYPEESFQDLQKGYLSWDDETFEIVTNFVYENINQHEIPSDEYIQKGVEIARQQITKAGYRLANIVSKIYNVNKAQTTLDESREENTMKSNLFLQE